MAQAALRDDKVAFAADPATTGKLKVSRPMNGEEYLESLRDGREIYIYGERVDDVTTHPAFRNTARMVARLYDALHDPKHKDKLLVPTDTGNGGMTHAFFKAPKTLAEIDRRSRRHRGMGQDHLWLDGPRAGLQGGVSRRRSAPMPISTIRGRTMPSAGTSSARSACRSSITPSSIRRSIAIKPPNEVGDVCCHVEKETDAGLIVSGAKVVATGSVLTNYTFVAHHGLIPVQDKKFAAVFMIPTNAPGVKFICRTSYEMTSTVMGSPVRLSVVEPAR